jgi:hypothetical protein
MRRTNIAAGIVLVGILILAARSSAAAIKEGEWSMTTNIRMEGMDEEAAEAMKAMENMSPEEKAMMENMMGGMGMKMRAAGGGTGMAMTMARNQCITNDNPVPESDDQEDCKQTYSMKGNTVNFEVICDDSYSTGQVTYKNDSMKGTIKSTSTKNGREETVILDMSGKYVGPCGQGNASMPGLSPKELAIRERELELKQKELELKQKELDLESSATKEKTKPTTQSALNDVNGAVSTTNNVKNTIGGLRSLFGR